MFYYYQINLVEVRASASLIFTLPKSELSKAQRALKGWRQNNALPTPKPETKTHEIDVTKANVSARTANRHAREWILVRELRETCDVHVVHYRELVRYKVSISFAKDPFLTNFGAYA